MNKCIFCLAEGDCFHTREHILPESLGGADWCVLPDGLVCDKCQNYLGAKVELEALSDYPFSLFRTSLGITTKKHKSPFLNSIEGTITGFGKGRLAVDPSPAFEQAWLSKHKTQMRIPAYPSSVRTARATCRLLLKMGLEVVAADSHSDAFLDKFEAARKFVRQPAPSVKWWFLQRENMNRASHYITNGVSMREWVENVELNIVDCGEEAELFHLKLLYLDFMIPLEQRILPDIGEELQEPEYRLFWA